MRHNPGMFTMKFSLFAAAAAGGLFGGQAFAAAGYLGGDYVHSEVDLRGVSVDADGWEAHGVVALDFAPPYGIALDADYAHPDHSDDTKSVAAHLYADINGYDRGGYLLGGFAGYANLLGEDVWSAGVETLSYHGDWTIGGAGAYAEDDDINVHGWALNGEARYFFTPMLRVQAGAGYAHVDTPLGDGDGTTVGAGAEYQPTMLPFSVFGDYLHLHVNDLGLDGDTFRIGLRYTFGGTLKDRDRSGAGLAGLSSVDSVIDF